MRRLRLPCGAGRRLLAVDIGLSFVVAGCESEPNTPSPVAATVAPETSARPPANAPLAREHVEIPSGKLLVGSRPGRPGRDPELEPRPYEVELGGFRMDKLPYPNDPAAPPLLGVSRKEATRRCAERGARLCTELEWERACKGPTNDEFVTGPRWDPSCTQAPQQCASAFDVLALSTLREWTASDVIPTTSDAKRLAAVRGTNTTPEAADHRCARREALAETDTAEDLGFRCCRGAPNAAKVKEPRLGPTFTKVKLDADRLEQLLASDPLTAPLARDVKYFREPEAAQTVVTRGPGNRMGFSFTVTPLAWNPAAGAEFLLITARSGDDRSFVLAYHVVAKDDYALAASYVMKGEVGPVAFAYSNDIRPRLHFSNCWGCPGETGKILFRPPESVAILQP